MSFRWLTDLRRNYIVCLTARKYVIMILHDKALIITRIWTAATGDDLGLITRRIEAADKTPHMDDIGDKDEAAQLSSPNHLPAIVEVCHTLVEHLKNMRGSVWLTATKIWISFLPSWKKAWQIKESVMMQLIETSRGRFASSSDVQHEATCAMDEIFKREARAEAKGRASTAREMIDETFAYIVGQYYNSGVSPTRKNGY